MTKAHQALTLANTTNTTLDNRLKHIFRLICGSDCYIAFKDGSFLVYEFSSLSYRQDRLYIVKNTDDLPF